MHSISESTLPRFFELLQERKITAKQVSDNTGVPQTTIASWRKGRCKPKVDAVETIASYLGVPTDYLLGKDSTDDPNEIKLIASYRKMNNAQKRILLNYAEFLENYITAEEYLAQMNPPKTPMDEIREELQLIKESLAKKLKSDD